MAKELSIGLGLHINPGDRTSIYKTLADISKPITININFASDITRAIRNIRSEVDKLNSSLRQVSATARSVGVGGAGAVSGTVVGGTVSRKPFGSYSSVSRSVAPSYLLDPVTQKALGNPETTISQEQARIAQQHKIMSDKKRMADQKFGVEYGLKDKYEIQKERNRAAEIRTEQAVIKAREKRVRESRIAATRAQRSEEQLLRKRGQVESNKVSSLGALSLAGALGGRTGLAGAAIGQMTAGSITSMRGKSLGQMSMVELEDYNNRLIGNRNRGLKIGAGVGVGLSVAGSIASGGFRLARGAVMGSGRFAYRKSDQVAEYQKQLRMLKNVVNGNPLTDESIDDSGIARLGDEVSRMAIKSGVGTITEYMEVFRDIVGKGLSAGAAKTFMEESSRLSGLTGTSIGLTTNLGFSLVSGNSDRYVKQGMITKDEYNNISFNGKKGKELYSVELAKINAMAASGGTEVEDIAANIGNINTTSSIGGISSMEVIALLEAISPIVPNPREAEVAVRNFFNQTGKPNKRLGFINRLRDSDIPEFNNMGDQLFEKKQKDKLTGLDIFSSMLFMADNKKYQAQKEGMSEGAILRELIGTDVKQLRGLKGAFSLSKSKKNMEKQMEILGSDNIGKLFASGTERFNLDKSMGSAKNFMDYKVNQYGSAAAPFVSRALMSAVDPSIKYDSAPLQTGLRKHVSEVYSGDENKGLRESLISFGGVADTLANQFLDLVGKFREGDLMDNFIKGVGNAGAVALTLAPLMLDLADGFMQLLSIIPGVETWEEKRMGATKNVARNMGFAATDLFKERLGPGSEAKATILGNFISSKLDSGDLSPEDINDPGKILGMLRKGTFNMEDLGNTPFFSPERGAEMADVLESAGWGAQWVKGEPMEKLKTFTGGVSPLQSLRSTRKKIMSGDNASSDVMPFKNQEAKAIADAGAEKSNADSAKEIAGAATTFKDFAKMLNSGLEITVKGDVSGAKSDNPFFKVNVLSALFDQSRDSISTNPVTK